MPPSNHRSRSALQDLAFVAIYSSGRDLDWPDRLDEETGAFTYFGDNKHPGHDLNHSAKGGNWLLHDIWHGLLSGELARADVPPFFIFFHGAKGQDVEFVGLAVPGGPALPVADALVTLWRSKEGMPFQNYRATMTVLDAALISREWISELKSGSRDTAAAPAAWHEWAQSGKYRPRLTMPTIEWRTPSQQKPQGPEQQRILHAIRKHYEGNAYAFEYFAAALVRMMEPARVTGIEVTQPRRDGGRDALGTFRIGFGADPITADFALEAKCMTAGLGVKQVARLLSRIRYRQFGIIVTTSYVGEQAYREIKEDRHPVAILAGRDIAQALISRGYGEDHRLQELFDEADALSAASGLLVQ